MPEIFLGQVSKWLSQLKASIQRNYCFSAFLQTARSQHLRTAMQGRRTSLEQPTLHPRAPGAGCLELLAWRCPAASAPPGSVRLWPLPLETSRPVLLLLLMISVGPFPPLLRACFLEMPAGHTSSYL